MPRPDTQQPLARMMRLRTRLPLAALGLLVIAQLISPDRAWMILLTGLGLTLGISWLWARAMRDQVHARRWSSGAWVVVGDAIIEHFELKNDSLLPVLWAEVADFSDAPDYQIARVAAVDGHGAFAWQTRGVCSRRGVFTLGRWELWICASIRSVLCGGLSTYPSAVHGSSGYCCSHLALHSGYSEFTERNLHYRQALHYYGHSTDCISIRIMKKALLEQSRGKLNRLRSLLHHFDCSEITNF